MPRDEFEALAVHVAAALARRFEGLFLQPYLCPAGVPSIAYGATYYEGGRRVMLKDPAITRPGRGFTALDGAHRLPAGRAEVVPKRRHATTSGRAD